MTSDVPSFWFFARVKIVFLPNHISAHSKAVVTEISRFFTCQMRQGKLFLEGYGFMKAPATDDYVFQGLPPYVLQKGPIS